MTARPAWPPSNADPLKQLRGFCFAARLGTLTGAAERLFSSQPALSRQVSDLEAGLDVELFDRRGSRISLTSTGERLSALATPLVEALDRLPDTFREMHFGDAAGPLTVAAGQGVALSVLPGHLKSFSERHPGVEVSLRLGPGERRLAWLRCWEVDVAFAAVDAVPPDLNFWPLFSSAIMLIVPEDHPLAGRGSVELGELAAHPMVGHPASCYVSEVCRGILRRHGQLVEPVVEVDGWDAIRGLVAAGAGIALVPDVCLQEDDGLWSIPVPEYFPPRRYGVLTRRSGVVSLAVRWFLRVLDEAVEADGGR